MRLPNPVVTTVEQETPPILGWRVLLSCLCPGSGPLAAHNARLCLSRRTSNITGGYRLCQAALHDFGRAVLVEPRTGWQLFVDNLGLLHPPAACHARPPHSSAIANLLQAAAAPVHQRRTGCCRAGRPWRRTTRHAQAATAKSWPQQAAGALTDQWGPEARVPGHGGPHLLPARQDGKHIPSSQ